MSGWVIRPASVGDLKQIVATERELATAPHWAEAEYEALMEPGQTQGVRRCCFVAADGETVLGFAVGSALRVGDAVEAELESVAVRTAAQRRGIGGALCRAVMAWSRSAGADSMLLEVRAGSAAVVRLYAGLGFVQTGRRVGYYRNPVEDAVVMQCRLADV